MLFMADEDLQMLQQSDLWSCDSTFSFAPDQDEQLYTIHALQNGVSHPCVYALLPGRSEADYEWLWNNVISLSEVNNIGNLAPTRIMTDFELGAINVLRRKFNGASLSACFFPNIRID